MAAGYMLLPVLIALLGSVTGQGLTPSTYLSDDDRSRLKSVFESVKPYQTAASIHYSVLGLKILGISQSDEKDICTKVNSLLTPDLETLFHVSAVSKGLTGCKVPLSEAHKKVLVDAITMESSVAGIFHSFLASKNFGLAVDEKKVKDSLLLALKRDDSPLSFGYAFHVASKMSGDVTRFYDSIEDVVAQADEVDERYLQFEGGLFITSLVIDATYKLAATAKKMPTISDNKVLKFTNYLLGRKYVNQAKSAYYLLCALKTLSVNKFYTPIALTLASPVAVTQSNPSVQVRVTDILGGDLGELTVTADSARHVKDDAVVISRKKFTRSTADKSVYEINLLEVKPARGFYRVDISVQRAGAAIRIMGNTGAVIQVKVTSQVVIEGVEIGVGDSDQTTAPRTTKLQHPNKAAYMLEADHHQKLLFKFKLRDKSSTKLITAHQTFVRLVNVATEQEIIFVTESDGQRLNTFDLEVGSKGKEFGYLSGVYRMELIVGDATIENPISWHVADISLTFADDQAVTTGKSKPFSKKPEIKHMFREQEKRPPLAISTAFTVLALLPMVILAVLWIKIGVNISNFPASVSAIAFHVCIAAIFALYFLYWLKLNMFDTIRYLALLAVPTFLFGNRLLSAIATKKK